MPVEADVACGELGRHETSRKNNFRYCVVSIIIHIILLLIIAPAAASSLSINSPLEFDVGASQACNLEFVCDEDTRVLSATVQIPEAFSCSKDSKIVLDDLESSYDPLVDGQFVNWDLNAALRSCRHITINEVEQNPEGPDSGDEWIEIYNPSSFDVDVGGWKLVDGYSGKTEFISEGTVIAAGGYHVIAWTNGSLINSYPTKITLFDSSGKEIDCTPEAKDEKNNDLCWARYPDGKDLGDDQEWKFQEATKGSSNGGSTSNIYAGETVALQFNLTPGCSAPSNATLFAKLSSSSGEVFAKSATSAVRRADLSVSVTPDRFEAAKGDEITWTIVVRDDGDGVAYDVQVNATLNEGLQLLEVDSPGKQLEWSYDYLNPGDEREVRVVAEAVLSCDNYSNIVVAKWGPGPCQGVRQASAVDRRTAIQKLPDEPHRLAPGEVISYGIDADLPMGAKDLWINDTIPSGLNYNSSSLSLHGVEPQKETKRSTEDGSQQICWFFGDVGPALRIEIEYNCALANSPENQDGAILRGTEACMTWSDGQGAKVDRDAAGSITVAEPDLILEASTTSKVAGINDNISYTLAAYHSAKSHAPAFDIELQDLLPDSMAYLPGSARVLSGPPATFDADSLIWHFDAIDLGWDSSRKVLITFNATCKAKPGDAIVDEAILTWTSIAGDSADERAGTGGVNDYLRRSSAQVVAMGLSISKKADPDPVKVGETLSYTLTYENEGCTVANNVTIIDELDPGVSFLFADPAPANADNNTWKIHRLAPNEPHSIEIKVRVDESLECGFVLANRFTIKSDELGPKSGTIYTRVLNETRLDVNKTSLQKAVRRGEEICYVIKVHNGGGQPATNVIVRDVFDSPVEFVSASPKQAGDGIWRFDSLAPGELIEIHLTVRVPRMDMKFEGHQKITGFGFVNAYRDYTTSQRCSTLTNRVYVSSDQMQLSGMSKVKILGEEGTSLCLREHGSGDYERSEDLHFLLSNKSIGLSQSMKAVYRPTTFMLPKNSSQRISSLWSTEESVKNKITNTEFCELHRYSTWLDHESHFELDENGSRLEMESDFRGLASIGVQKRTKDYIATTEDDISKEEYIGGFLVWEKIDDSGQSLIWDRSVSGQGYLNADVKIKNAQGSHESGTGAFQSDERIETLSNFMRKDIDAAHLAQSYEISPSTHINISQRFTEGMWSQTPSSFIGEEVSGAKYLKKNATFWGLRAMESEINFSGTAKLRTAYAASERQKVDEEETLIGDFDIKRKLMISCSSKYDRPHLYLQKKGRLIGDVAAYTITITNDGNAALGPLFLRDTFPPGSRFLNASLRPVKLESNSCNWTLLHLAIGDSAKIEIYLDTARCDGDIINLVEATGAQGTTEKNQSIIYRAWLDSSAREVLPADITCPWSVEEKSDEIEYLDPVLAKWEDRDGSAWPLNCPNIDDAATT